MMNEPITILIVDDHQVVRQVVWPTHATPRHRVPGQISLALKHKVLSTEENPDV